MLSQLNTFAKKTLATLPTLPPTSPPSGSSVAAAEASVKGKQLLRGRTKARVEAVTAEAEAARLTLAQAEQTLGERMADGLDVTAATDAMKQAGDRVRTLEAALAVAIQKDEQAQIDLKHAERFVIDEAKESALAHLKLVVAPKVDQIFVDLERLVTEELGPALNAARAALNHAGGNAANANFLTDLSLSFELYVYKACHMIMPKGRAYLPLLGDKPWSSRIPD